MRPSPLPPHTRALMRALLLNHTAADTHALLSCSLSGAVVTKKQVSRAAWDMRKAAGRTAAKVQAEDRARMAVGALTIPRAPTATKRPLTFDEQLARVAAGARLVPSFRPSRSAPDQTLGGVATGLL